MDPRLLLALLAASRGAGAAPAVAPLRLRARALAAQPHDDDRSWVEAMIGAPGTAAETIYLAPVEAAASASAVVADFRGEGGISHIIVPAEQGVAAPVKIFDSLLAVWRLFSPVRLVCTSCLGILRLCAYVPWVDGGCLHCVSLTGPSHVR